MIDSDLIEEQAGRPAGLERYCLESRVRYSEVDENGRLSLFHLMNYLQDCCTFQSEDLKIGIDYSAEKGRAWVLGNWQLFIDRYFGLGEKIKIWTWAYDFRLFIGYRNFLVEDEKGNPIVRANSEWVYMDMINQKPVKPEEEQLKAYGIHPAWKLTDPFGPRRIRIPGKAGQKDDLKKEDFKKEAFMIQPWHLDTNHHVNNAKFIELAQGFLPAGYAPSALRAEYKNQARLGDKILPKVYPAGGSFVVTLENEENLPYFVGEFRK